MTRRIRYVDLCREIACIECFLLYDAVRDPIAMAGEKFVILMAYDKSEKSFLECQFQLSSKMRLVENMCKHLILIF